MFPWTLECCFENADGNFSVKGRKFPAQFSKMLKKYQFFSKKSFSLKLLQWTCMIKFRQPRQKIFAKRPKHFRSRSENDRLLRFSQKTGSFYKCSHGHVECSFENTSGKLSVNGRNFSAHCPNMIKKGIFSKSVFSLKIFLGTRRTKFQQPRSEIFAKS